MSEITFRAARLDDLSAIIAMLARDSLGAQREIVSDPPDPAYVEAFAAIERDPNQMMLVADLNSAVVGCAQLSFIPGLSRRGMRRGQIEGVRIDMSLRGLGLGQRMMAFAIEQCRKRGCGLVQLTTDKSRVDTVRFYERLGFVASHEGLKLIL